MADRSIGLARLSWHSKCFPAGGVREEGREEERVEEREEERVEQREEERVEGREQERVEGRE